MQINGVCGGGQGPVKPEDVISKMKDDGDYDKLRLKIIRKLKENEELRSDIASMVKQSTALNSTGAENMKPRQLSDSIHQEIGDKLMSKISDSLWSIIRSADGMKTEITETVQVVYDKLSNPRGKDNGESSSRRHSQSVQSKHENGDVIGVNETDGPLSDGSQNQPPGSGLIDARRRSKKKKTVHPNTIRTPPRNIVQSVGGNEGHNIHSKGLPEPDNLDDDAPPGYSVVLNHKTSGEVSDEDPELPPGFG